jgi:hypothetical protein
MTARSNTTATRVTRRTEQSPSTSPAPGNVHANVIRIVTCRVDLPEHLYDSYSDLARTTNRPVEDLLQQQLSRCRDIIGSGIYFNEAQKKRLSNLIGHTVADAEGALQRLETSTVVDVSGFAFELDPRLIQRLKTRVFRGEQYSDVMYREIVRALMQFAGMNPPLSNTGGWWRRKSQGTGAVAVPAVVASNGHTKEAADV